MAKPTMAKSTTEKGLENEVNQSNEFLIYTATVKNGK